MSDMLKWKAAYIAVYIVGSLLWNNSFLSPPSAHAKIKKKICRDFLQLHMNLLYIRIKSLIKNCKSCRGSGFLEVHEADVYKDGLVNIDNKIVSKDDDM